MSLSGTVYIFTEFSHNSFITSLQILKRCVYERVFL